MEHVLRFLADLVRTEEGQKFYMAIFVLIGWLWVMSSVISFAFADASVDLGHGETRFDIARDWCEDNPNQRFIMLDPKNQSRVLFSFTCSNFEELANAANTANCDTATSLSLRR